MYLSVSGGIIKSEQ